MVVLITGATGLIGQEIVKLCHERGMTVHYLSTSKSKLKDDLRYKGFYWDLNKDFIDHNCFDGVEVVINLVGASISNRWTARYKQEIIDSRVKAAELLVATISKYKFPVRHVIAASAIGIYPSSLTHYYDESNSEISTSFLGKVVEQWETANDAFTSVGCDISKVRIGLVLSDGGGALPKLIQPIKYGLGAAFGSGEQWQSWIHVEDLAAMFMFILEEELTGVFNATAPNPVTNSELTKGAAATLDKPLVLPNIPKFVMSAILGEMHILLFESQRVSSKKIESNGFQFYYPNLKPALESLLS